jgi:diguanylate cyclase (GGDEF)-like protein
MENPPSARASRYIAEILKTLANSNQHERVLHLIIDRIVRLTHCQTCAIVLINPRTEYLHIENSFGLSLTFCNQFRRRIATAAIGNLLWTGTPIIITGKESNHSAAIELQLEHSLRSCVCLQIGVDHQTLGYLHVDSEEPEAFTDEEVELLGLFADIAGIALNKSHLFEENLRLERIDKETDLEKYPPFLERVQGAVARASEFGEKFGILLLDVDNFKEIVKTYGYDLSRHVLREMAAAVRIALRPIDGAGRYGFDEFVILIENADLHSTIQKAQELRESIAGMTYTDKAIHSSVSLGVAAYPQNGLTADDLILSAKKALFEAQRKGRNSVFWFEDEWFAHDARHTPPEGLSG